MTRFGASQVVGYTNEEQGEVRSVTVYEVEMSVVISLNGAVESACIESLEFLTNFARLYRRSSGTTVTNRSHTFIPLKAAMIFFCGRASQWILWHILISVQP